jgi:hypothetical protein
MVKTRVPDIEREISEKAEELAQAQYGGSSFDELTKDLQFKVWSQAEQHVAEARQMQAESLHDFWQEVELERRLGN